MTCHSVVGSSLGRDAECRLCLGPADDELIAPCRCAGSVRWVHRGCLDRWRASGQNPRAFTHCCACGFRYKLLKSDMTSQRSQSTVWQPARLALRLLLIAVPLAFCIFITETRKSGWPGCPAIQWWGWWDGLGFPTAWPAQPNRWLFPSHRFS
eukprot:g27656.t1